MDDPDGRIATLKSSRSRSPYLPDDASAKQGCVIPASWRRVSDLTFKLILGGLFFFSISSQSTMTGRMKIRIILSIICLLYI